MEAGLSKSERLCNVTAISLLVSKGRYLHRDPLRCCFLRHGVPESGCNRILVSVPKRNFKRAVKRNLLKRRIREAYRLQKDILPGSGLDIMFTYTSKEVETFDTIFSAVGALLRRIASCSE